MFKIRFLCLLLCAALCGALAMPVSAVMTDRIPDQVDRLAVEVRYTMGADDRVIGLLEDGAEVTVLGKSWQYYMVDCAGLFGYVHEEHILRDRSGTYYVNCNPQSEAVHQLPAQEGEPIIRSILTVAQTMLGIPYVYGGETPLGFDCSGFVQYCYESQGIEVHRGGTGQLSDGLIVPWDEVQPGDLVFFNGTGNAPEIANHVGIYMGDGKFIHAGSKGVMISSLKESYFAQRMLGVRRIIVSGVSEYTSLPDATVQRQRAKGFSTVRMLLQ